MSNFYVIEFYTTDVENTDYWLEFFQTEINNIIQPESDFVSALLNEEFIANLDEFSDIEVPADIVQRGGKFVYSLGFDSNLDYADIESFIENILMDEPEIVVGADFTYNHPVFGVTTQTVLYQ